MARLRIKLVLNEGGEGIPLSQLASISEEAEKFLRYLGADAGIKIGTSNLVARRFENRSVRFDIEDDGDHQLEEIKGFNNRLAFAADFKAPRGQSAGTYVRHQTMLQFAKVADALGGHEKLSFGIYHPNGDEPYEYRPLTKSAATDLRAALTESVNYTGTLQGRIHAISVAEAWFQFRPGVSEKLVRCTYNEDQYQNLIEAAKDRKRRVYIRGNICARRFDRELHSVSVSSIKAAPKLSNDRYEKFFGAGPDYTGSFTTDQFVEAARGYDQ